MSKVYYAVLWYPETYTRTLIASWTLISEKEASKLSVVQLDSPPTSRLMSLVSMSVMSIIWLTEKSNWVDLFRLAQQWRFGRTFRNYSVQFLAEVPATPAECIHGFIQSFWVYSTVVPKRCVLRDHEVCREIKKYIFKLILIMIKNWTND
jgi:hypothetical protein